MPEHVGLPWHALVELPKQTSFTSSPGPTIVTAATAGPVAESGIRNTLQLSPLEFQSTGRLWDREQPDQPDKPQPSPPTDLPVDINFWFFLVVYYGAYLAVALIWITCLFNLYRCSCKDHKISRLS